MPRSQNQFWSSWVCSQSTSHKFQTQTSSGQPNSHHFANIFQATKTNNHEFHHPIQLEAYRPNVLDGNGPVHHRYSLENKPPFPSLSSLHGTTAAATRKFERWQGTLAFSPTTSAWYYWWRWSFCRPLRCRVHRAYLHFAFHREADYLAFQFYTASATPSSLQSYYTLIT